MLLRFVIVISACAILMNCKKRITEPADTVWKCPSSASTALLGNCRKDTVIYVKCDLEELHYSDKIGNKLHAWEHVLLQNACPKNKVHSNFRVYGKKELTNLLSFSLQGSSRFTTPFGNESIYRYSEAIDSVTTPSDSTAIIYCRFTGGECRSKEIAAVYAETAVTDESLDLYFYLNIPSQNGKEEELREIFISYVDSIIIPIEYSLAETTR